MRSSERPFRSKIGWDELRLLFAYVAFFGGLLVMPLWYTIVLRESSGGWAGVVVGFIVGLAAFIALWRYLGRPVRPEDEGDDLLHRRGWQRPDSR